MGTAHRLRGWTQMPEYRRSFAPGGTIFLTLVTNQRNPLFADPAAVSLLRRATAAVMQDFSFELLAAVVLPEHIHFLWELPPDDSDFSSCVGRIKVAVTCGLRARGAATDAVSSSRRRHRESGIWQRRFWEHTIRDEADFSAHMDYIHYNPVKHGRASCPHAWSYSSFHRWVRRGAYEADWCCVCYGRTAKPPRFDRIAGTVGE